MDLVSEKSVKVGEIEFHNEKPFVLLAGVNVLETEDTTFKVAAELKATCEKLDIPFIFKASFDKANRSSIESYRGLAWEQSARIFDKLRKEMGLKIITDIHEPAQAEKLAEVVDIIQIPAFLCRQTDLVFAAAKTNKPIHIKKMQMMAPWDMKNVVQKFNEAGNDQLILCERGTSFGYNNLVVDPLGFPELKQFGFPITFDVTHSLQQPGGLGKATAGRGRLALPLAKSGMIQGLAGLFLETHPDPSKAKCDGPCATPLAEVESFLSIIKDVDRLAKNYR